MTSTAPELYGRAEGFAPPSADDEFLHRGTVDDYTLSETSYLGFNIPEEGINAEIYHWFHPELGTTSGGVIIWQGNKPSSADADYIDYRNFMPYPTGGIQNHHYPTGIRIEVEAPLRALKAEFESPDGETRFELRSEAIMPPAGRVDGHHFAQAMRNRGYLVLNGVRHEIDGYFTRDRSYGSPRPEVQQSVPPLTWGAAVFDDDFALHFVGIDAPEVSTEAVRWGYIWDGTTIESVVSIRKKTLRCDDGVTPYAAEIDLVDACGRRFEMRATELAKLPMSFWPNMITNLVLMRYELSDGRVGHGDYQDVVFNHFLRSARKLK